MPDTRARTSAIRVGAMRPGNSRITAKGAGCNSTTLTSGTDRLSSLLGEAGPSLQPASSPANSKAITLLWSTERAVILLQPLRCCPQACAVGERRFAASPVATRPGTVPSQWLRRFHGIGRSPRLMRAQAGYFFLSSRNIARRNAKRGPWRLGESRQGKPSREWEGTQLGNFVLGQIGHPRLATSRATVVRNDPGRVIRVRRRFHRICRRWVKRKCVGLSSRTICRGVAWTAPSGAFSTGNFLSFAFFADPAQLAQVFERSVQRELVRSDFGKPVLGVHWSHQLAPENVLLAGAALAGLWNRCLR